MLHLNAYLSAADLPPHFECQLRSFQRILWPAASEDERDEPLTAPDLHPAYFVLARKQTVISSGRTIWAQISHQQTIYKVYGLGDVFTFPASRHKGYGSQIVAAATNHIRSDASADMAMLVTEPALEAFYAHSGWEHVSNRSLLTGQEARPEYFEGFPMMLFLSQKARALRPSLARQPFFLPGDEW